MTELTAREFQALVFPRPVFLQNRPNHASLVEWNEKVYLIRADSSRMIAADWGYKPIPEDRSQLYLIKEMAQDEYVWMDELQKEEKRRKEGVT